MKDIELVIKMPKEQYDLILRSDIGSTSVFVSKECMMHSIKNGTQLPKGHKRLIEDNFEVGPVFDEEGNRVGYRYVTQEDLNNALTIIEADKEETTSVKNSK